MRSPRLLLLASLAASITAHAQSMREAGYPAGEGAVQGVKASTIEGYWQDVARRVLFMRGAPSSAVYGTWNLLDQQQTYPSAKLIRRSGKGYELVDLLYDHQHDIKVIRASENQIEFVRSPVGSTCGVRHACRLDGDELFCSLENICREGGGDVLDWRGEERYARRANCERVGRLEAQGIPVSCRSK